MPTSSRHYIAATEWREDAHGQPVEHPAGTYHCKHTSGDFRYGPKTADNPRGGVLHAEHVTTDRADAYRWCAEQALAYRAALPRAGTRARR